MKGFKIWFPPGDASAPIRVHGIGIQERMRPCVVDRPHGTGDYLFMFFHDPVRIRVRGAPRDLPAETLLAWHPGDDQCYGHRERPFVHSWLHGDGPAVARVVEENGIPRGEPMVLADAAATERVLLGLHEEMTAHAAPDPAILESYFSIWMRETRRRLRGGDAARPTMPAGLVAARRHLESHFDETIRLEDLAEEAHLSVPHFCAEFKRCFGAPAIDYLIRVRMHRAVHLLRDRNLRIGEIARRVGIEDPYYFSRLFKKHFGASPRAMRRAGTGR